MISQLESTPFLPPANEVFEGYVFTGVCLSPGGGSAPIARWADNPLARHPPRQTPLGRHPLPPWQTPPAPPGQTPSPLPAQCMLVYGQKAGGTHPTGMHSCLNVIMCRAFKLKICLVRNSAVLKKLLFFFHFFHVLTLYHIIINVLWLMCKTNKRQM